MTLKSSALVLSAAFVTACAGSYQAAVERPENMEDSPSAAPGALPLEMTVACDNRDPYTTTESVKTFFSSGADRNSMTLYFGKSAQSGSKECVVETRAGADPASTTLSCWAPKAKTPNDIVHTGKLFVTPGSIKLMDDQGETGIIGVRQLGTKCTFKPGLPGLERI